MNAALLSALGCGPSGSEGAEALKARRLPHPRLLRVLTPVTGFTPSARRHSLSCCALSTSALVKSAWRLGAGGSLR